MIGFSMMTYDIIVIAINGLLACVIFSVFIDDYDQFGSCFYMCCIEVVFMIIFTHVYLYAYHVLLILLYSTFKH